MKLTNQKIFTHNPVLLPNIKSITSENGDRVYITPEGNRYPSVTTILSKLPKGKRFEDWVKGVGEQQAETIKKVAAKRGTKLHLYCEKYLNNQNVNTSELFPDMKLLFNKTKLVLENVSNIRMIEGALWSDQYKFAGKTDLVADWKNSIAVLDFKQTEADSLYSEDKKEAYFTQLGGYAIAFEERTGINIDTAVLLISSVGYETIPVVQSLTGGDFKRKFLTAVENYYRIVN